VWQSFSIFSDRCFSKHHGDFDHLDLFLLEIHSSNADSNRRRDSSSKIGWLAFVARPEIEGSAWAAIAETCDGQRKFLCPSDGVARLDQKEEILEFQPPVP
jgi:hypothetical protein